MDETTLAELSDRLKAKVVPPSTFARLGGGRLDPDAWLTRLDKAAETLEAEIHNRGPRNFTELLVVLEKAYCPKCDGRAAECPIADFVARSKKRWAGTEFCQRCFGRFVGTFPIVKDDKKIGDRRVYADSEPFYVLDQGGKFFFVARCDCAAALNMYGEKHQESAAGLKSGLCAVHRWRKEQQLMSATYARWQREAQHA